MAISYPTDCDSPRRRLEYLYRAQELLRLFHNVFSRWRRTGLTQTQYNKLPAKIKNKYPYKPQLTQGDILSFLADDFEPRSQKICSQINIQRGVLKQSTHWTPKVEDI